MSDHEYDFDDDFDDLENDSESENDGKFPDSEDETSDCDECIESFFKTSSKSSKKLEGDERTTKPIISIIDVTALISQRAKDLSMGQEDLLTDEERERVRKRIKGKYNASLTVIDIAKEEFLLKKDFPLFLVRSSFPDGCYEEWKVSEIKSFPIGYKPIWAK